jgi:hypothetical protein
VAGEIIQISDPGGKGRRFWPDVFISLINDEQPRFARYHQIVNDSIQFVAALAIVGDVSPVALMLV